MGPCGRTSIYDGIPVVMLQANLASAQAALNRLEQGGMLVKATYSQADGTRQVEYQPGDKTTLRMYILELQTALDSANGAPVNRRRPLRPYFR